MEPNFMFCWPNAQFGIASSSDIQMASGSHMRDPDTPQQDQTFLDEVLYPSSSLYHDGVILPSETRQVD